MPQESNILTDVRTLQSLSDGAVELACELAESGYPAIHRMMLDVVAEIGHEQQILLSHLSAAAESAINAQTT